MADGSLLDLPLIIAGPIVRRIEPEAASVFVALRAPRVIELTVHHPGRSGFVRAGVRATVPLGPHLHVAVVTADVGEALRPDATYEYDLGFTDRDGVRRWLGDDGVLVPRVAAASLVDRLIYRAGDRPRFTVPPADARALRVVQGSCRKLHGAGDDALAHLDHLIGDAIARRVTAPHLLCLTGDQIYADDVHTSLLRALRVYASHDLDDAEDRVDLAGLMPSSAPSSTAASTALAPGRRQATLEQRAGLTSTAMASHLVTFAEYAAMYVFAWSPVPWAIFDAIPADLAASHRALPAVRRALANVSVLTIFDDHEVTDDWNIRRGWYERVMNLDLGRRVVRNALAAYALFQHWGNDPAAFVEGSADGSAGGALLDCFDRGWRGAIADASLTLAVEHRLGLVADPIDLARARTGALHYDWRLVTPAAVFIGLDCRMRRGLPAGDRVDLISRDAIDEQLPAGERARLTILLTPTPLLGWQLLETMQDFGASLGDSTEFDHESWAQSPSHAFLVDRLIERGPSIVLSGDVHYGFAVHLSMARGAKQGRAVVNLVSSALKNRSDGLARVVHAAEWAAGAFRGDDLDVARQAALRAGLAAAVLARDGEAAGPYAETVVGDLPVVIGADQTLDLRGLDPHTRDRWPLTAWSQLGELRLWPDEGIIEQTTWWVDRRGVFAMRSDEIRFDFGGSEGQR